MSRDSFKLHVWELLEVTEDPDTGKIAWDWVDVFLLALIVLNVLSVIFETVPRLWALYWREFIAFEIFSVAVFTAEYVARLWACTVDPRFSSPLEGRLRYAGSFFGIIDVLAIAPLYVSLAVSGTPGLLGLAAYDLRFLRVLRLTRFARVLKIGRYTEAMDRLKAVFGSRKADLGVAAIALLVILVLSSSLMYHVEHEKQPEAFSSIPASMWWGISTLTTVGYGDIRPMTPLGKSLGGVIQLLGIAFFALPAGILAAGYEDESRRRRDRETGSCALCGRPFEQVAEDVGSAGSRDECE